MAGGGDAPPDTRNVAVWVDQERDAMRPSEGPLADRPLPPGAVRLGNGVAHIGKDRKVKRELVAEGGLALLIIWAYTPDDGARVLQCALCVAELTRLNRAAWSVVLWIEVEGKPAPRRSGERSLGAIRVA